MKIVNLIRRDSLPLEQRKSYVGKSSLDWLPSSKVFAGHVAEVGCGCAEGQPVAFVVSPHASEAGAASKLAFEMIDVGKLYVGLGRLIMIAILIQPGNRKRATASIERP